MRAQNKHYVIVEHRSSKLFDKQEKEIRELRSSLLSLQKQYRNLEQRFGYEVLLNSELIDLLRLHNIEFRDHLEYKKHPF